METAITQQPSTLCQELSDYLIYFNHHSLYFIFETTVVDFVQTHTTYSVRLQSSFNLSAFHGPNITCFYI